MRISQLLFDPRIISSLHCRRKPSVPPYRRSSRRPRGRIQSAIKCI